MAVNWNTSELDKIKQQMLDDKPQYYLLPNKLMVPISEDMEGFLILQTQEQKQKILSWIKKVTSIQTANKDRDALLDTYLQVRLQDTTDRISEMDTVLDGYSKMQNDIVTDGDDSSRYAGIIDLNLMIRSISRSVNMITMQRDQAFHEQNLTKLLQLLLTSNKIDDDTQKELSSWQNVLSTYSGQTSKEKQTPVGTASFGGLS